MAPRRPNSTWREAAAFAFVVAEGFRLVSVELPSAGTETVPDVRTAVVPCVTETVETVPVAAAEVVEPDAPAVTVEPLAAELEPLPAAMAKLSD